MATVDFSHSQSKAEKVQSWAFEVQRGLSCETEFPETPQAASSDVTAVVQMHIYEVVALGYMLRSLVSELSEQIENVDPEVMRPMLQKAVESARVATSSVLESVDQFSSSTVAHTGFRKVDELQSWSQELGDIERWLQGWPTFDNSYREQVRAEIDRQEFMSEDEMNRLLQASE